LDNRSELFRAASATINLVAADRQVDETAEGHGFHAMPPTLVDVHAWVKGVDDMACPGKRASRPWRSKLW
jgi:hypothetical protein